MHDIASVLYHTQNVQNSAMAGLETGLRKKRGLGKGLTAFPVNKTVCYENIDQRNYPELGRI